MKEMSCSPRARRALPSFPASCPHPSKHETSSTPLRSYMSSGNWQQAQGYRPPQVSNERQYLTLGAVAALVVGAKTPNQKPLTRTPKPSTLIPNPSTLSPKPKIINPTP